MSESRREAHKSIKVNDAVWGWIVEWLQQELSPQQVVAYLRRHKGVSLHHETVYRLIYGDKAEGGELYPHLRILCKPYRKRYGYYDRRGRIRNRMDSDDRPAVVDERSRIGDWEGDTVMGKGCKSALLTLVERKTRYIRIIRRTCKRAVLLAQAVLGGMRDIADQVKTITFENSLEFAEHEQIAFGLDDVYFAHPYAAWERSVNENTNGLIQQYFAKGTDFNEVTDEQVQFVMDRLNNRPRATLNHRSPNELFMGQ